MEPKSWWPCSVHEAENAASCKIRHRLFRWIPRWLLFVRALGVLLGAMPSLLWFPPFRAQNESWRGRGISPNSCLFGVSKLYAEVAGADPCWRQEGDLSPIQEVSPAPPARASHEDVHVIVSKRICGWRVCQMLWNLSW